MRRRWREKVRRKVWAYRHAVREAMTTSAAIAKTHSRIVCERRINTRSRVYQCIAHKLFGYEIHTFVRFSDPSEELPEPPSDGWVKVVKKGDWLVDDAVPEDSVMDIGDTFVVDEVSPPKPSARPPCTATRRIGIVNGAT